MAQNFNSLKASSLIKNDRQTINDNFDAVRSCHSGTAYPTTELVAGMLFFNTSTKKLYEYNGSAWVQILDLSSGTAVAPKSGNADSATKATGDKNGKDITTYVAKLEQDTNNKFVIRVYNGANTLMTTITIPETDVDVMTGASASSAGKAGLVPTPTAGAKNRYLNAYGDFDEIDVPVKSVNGKTGDVVVDVGVTSVNNKTGAVTLKESPSDMTDYIVESYRDGYNWYRVWRSGWVEQGGGIISVAQSGSTLVTLHKAFKDANYMVFAQDVGDMDGLEYIGWFILEETATNFKIGHHNWATKYIWYACGQGA